jgi:hypothetical protein
VFGQPSAFGSATQPTSAFGQSSLIKPGSGAFGSSAPSTGAFGAPSSHLGTPALALEPVVGFLLLHLSRPGLRQHQRKHRRLDSRHLEPLPLHQHKVHLLHRHKYKVPSIPRHPPKVLLALRHLLQAQSAGPPQYPSPPSEQRQRHLRSVAQALELHPLVFLRLWLLLLLQLQWQQPQPKLRNRLPQDLGFHDLKFR